MPLPQFFERFGRVSSLAILGLLYYGILGPCALVYQRVCDPLHLKRRGQSHWRPWRSHGTGMRAARRQG